MRLSRNPKLVMEDKAGGERRRHGRLRCKETTCCIGEVLDLSASGMRVQRRGRPVMEIGDQLKVSIQTDSDEPTLALNLRVVRLGRSGLRQHIYGLEFANLSDDQKRQLGALARVATDQLVFPCSYK